MKKYLLLAAVVLSMSASFAFTTTNSFAFKTSDEHLTGYIDDSECAASKSNMSPGESRIACVKKCIKGGASAVLVVGDKVYKISNQKAVLKYAGKNVSVDGKVTNDTIEVTKVTEEKS
jgi:hypothetical protein